MFRQIFAAILLFAAPAAFAQTVIHPYAPPAGFEAQSQLHMANGRPAPLYPTSPAANWAISMMGPPAADPPAPNTSFWKSWQEVPFHSWSWAIPWGTSTVLQSPGGWSTNLNYYGEDATDCVEHDLALGPAPNAVSSVYGTTMHFPTLAQLTSVKVTGQVTLVSMRHPASSLPDPCPTEAIHAGLLVIAILTDTTAKQMIWYQLQLGHVAFDGSGPLTSAVEFWNGKNHMTGPVANYAETDPISLLGEKPLTAPGTLNFDVDILPRLVALTQAGSGIDTNLANWKMDGISLEDQHWGQLDLTVSYQGFDPTWTLK